MITKDEKALIHNGQIDEPFRVLTVDNEEDSLFLRKECIDIPNIKDDKDIQYFIARLKQTMIAQSGVGIAAPQVGLGRNIFLFMRIDKPNYPIQVAINPKITAHPEEVICFEGDGCLSIPGKSGNTKRYEWVEVEYHNEQGELIKEKLNGASRGGDFTGIIFQHEFDHLRGILFTDKLYE